MQVSFNPLEPREANAVRILLGIPLDVPTVTVPDGSLPATDPSRPAAEAVAQPTPPKSHKKKPATPAVVPPEQQVDPAAPATVPSVGDLPANSTQPAPAPTGGKPLTVEDVRAAYRDLFAAIGEEKGKEELRKELAKVGSATVSDLKPGHFPAVVRSLNAATILAKAKVAPAAAAAPAKDPLL